MSRRLFELSGPLHRLLLEPGRRLIDPERRATAGLFAGALLVLVVLFGSYDAFLTLTRPGWRPPWPAYLLMLGAYALVRLGHYLPAVIPTVCMFPLVAFGLVVSGRSPHAPTTLTFPILSILLATLLLDAVGTALIALVSAVLIALTTLVGRAPLPWSAASGPLLINLVGGAIGVISIVHRGRLERERRQALVQSAVDLERRVEARTQELARAVAELETFSYSVSHDLRAPLRAIEGFSAMLTEDHAEGLKADGLELVQVIRQSGQRMADLIDGLLALSLVTQQPLSRRDIQLSPVVQEIFATLKAGEPERSVDLVVAPALTVNGDPTLVRTILDNLIGNGWKFTANAERARITLSQTETDGRAWITVADNGAGFDMAHAKRLFEPFERLHQAEEFPGTGVGLATVERAVLRHGGAIVAESSPGEGATFRFHLGP
jgi:signal transduction histidine kinase